MVIAPPEAPAPSVGAVVSPGDSAVVPTEAVVPPLAVSPLVAFLSLPQAAATKLRAISEPNNR
jgi:hypothetical protein